MYLEDKLIKDITDAAMIKISNMESGTFRKIAGSLQQAGQAMGGVLKYGPIGTGIGALAGLAYEDASGDPSHDWKDYAKSGLKGGLIGTGLGSLFGAAKTYLNDAPVYAKLLQDKIDLLTKPTKSMKLIKRELNTWKAISKGKKLNKPFHTVEELENLLKWHVAKGESNVKDLRKQLDILNNGGFWENAWNSFGY